MILGKKHIIARKVADEFRERLILTHAELLTYPLQYLNLQVAVTEHFKIIVDEIPEMSVRKIRAKLNSLGLGFPGEAYDEFLELAGFFYATDDTAFIYIEQNDSEERKKFSLSHEISHFLNEYFKIKLKKKDHDTLSLFEEESGGLPIVVAKRCTKKDVFTPIYGKEEPDFAADVNKVSIEQLMIQREQHQNRLRERICDWFAAELLMPVDILKQQEPTWIKSGASLEKIVEEVQALFGVSYQAARVRVEELKLGTNVQQSLIE